MPRTTLSDIRFRSLVPERLNLTKTDPRIPIYVNAYQQRLLPAGRWWGAYARFHICAANGCFSAHSQIATIERAAVCGVPVPIHDMWWEFLDNGWGTSGLDGPGCASCGGSFGCGCAYGAKFRGNFPTFDDIIGTNKKLLLVCDLASDVGKEVLLLGYDSNGNWVRTLQSGTIQDGEIVLLAQGAGTQSTIKFSSITDIQPPDDLDGQWWLYEWNVDTSQQRMIGKYEYWEQRPSYPRWLFGGICNSTSNDDGCNKTLIEVVAKLEFIPVVKDTDYLILGNVPACEYGVQGVKYSMPPADLAKANGFFAMAENELQKELDHYLGAGRRIGMNIVGNSVGAADPIESFL